MSGGGGSRATTTETTREPWSGQKPFLTQGFEEAQSLLEGPKPSFFPGSTVVPFSPESQLAMGMRTSNALGGGGTSVPAGGLFGPGGPFKFIPTTLAPGSAPSGHWGQERITNPALARLQGQIDQTPETITTPGVDNSAQLGPLQAELARLRQQAQSSGEFTGSSEGDFPGDPGQGGVNPRLQRQMDDLTAQIGGLQGATTPETTGPNPELARLRAQLAGLDPTVANPDYRPYGFPGAGGSPGGGGGLPGAGGERAGLIGLAEGETGKTLRGEYLRPDNPVMAGMLRGVSDVVRPGVDTRFASAGRFGSPIHAEAMARGVTTGMLPFVGAERARQYGAVRDAEAVSQFAPRELERVGRAREGMSRDVKQEELDRFNFGENVDAMKLREFMQNITGNYGGTVRSTSTQPTFSNPLMQGLGGAAALASIGQSAFGKADGAGFATGK